MSWLLVIGVVVAGTYVARAPILASTAGFLDVSEPPGRVDAVMVLGGHSETRPFVAAALVNAGLSERVLVATIKLSPEAEDGIAPPEHDMIRHVLRERGVRDDAIVQLPDECNSTFDEANALARFLDEHPQASVAVVTTNYHTRRSRWVFRRVLGERAERVHFIGAPTDGFDANNWWKFEAGFLAYTQEYVKFAYYLLRY